jgi:micrococcal nuclease
VIRSVQLILAVPLLLVVVLALVPARVATAQPAAGAEGSVPGPRIVLGHDPKTGQRYIQIAGQNAPPYPTIDLLCDGKRWTVGLARSEGGSIYEPPRSVTEAMLTALDCRMFLPDREVTLARGQLWAAWANQARGSEAPPPILVGQVLDVVDGNTIRVNLGDRVESVRYIGINAKQTTQAPKGPNPSGGEITDVNRQLVARQQVRLELDAQERDRDGRLLAYVFVADRMVNAELVRRGSAEVMTIQPNVRYRDLFVTLEQEARDDRRGLWANQSEPTTPTSVAQASPGPKERPGVAPETAWACPAAHPVKGNVNAFSSPRCIYHVPDSELYSATKPDRCYATVDDARSDGCQAARR